jgi:small subunit ribosomal protein S3
LGQKVNPIGFRLGVIEEWQSRWYGGKKDYSWFLYADFQIRNFLMEKFKKADVSNILIERATNKLKINIFAARPGIIIGKRGEIIEKTKEELLQFVKDSKIFLNVQEITHPELDAHLVAERVAFQLKRRVGTKRVMREAVSRAMESGAEGAKVMCKGRIGGAEIARKEWMKEGRVPLHTLRAKIDYGVSTAHTTYGCIGVKVWIYKGEILPVVSKEESKDAFTTEKGEV